MCSVLLKKTSMYSVRCLRSTKFITLEQCILTAFGRRLCTSNHNKDEGDPSKTGENLKHKKEGDDKSQIHDRDDAKMKLHNLLKEMIKEEPLTEKKSGLSLAKPKKTAKEKPVKDESGVLIDRKVIDATKDVAKSLGGDVKETESELLEKLLSTKSQVLGGMAVEQIESTKQWRDIRREQAQFGRSVSEVKRQPRFSKGSPTSVNLFGGSPLGIFTAEKQSSPVHDPVAPSIWEKLQEREVRLSTSHPPRNYFQQMILWTEQGKLWKFPIDNEQGLEEEQEVFFTEHVFLERYLEPWCPSKGPVRHFMELVCVGLSKNPYITVQDKKDHIYWYRDYFAAKKDILKEVGALPDETGASSPTASA
ncbi:hypothetical protein J437_LFUL000080 [Ladona fulva]|uniref:Small ribosomal subunit protein mS31 n=1 Tax=Ladona fulva TaxID=123851 RepID=A0A8K0NXH1_LADFU|nr:hypothetical protein J437_LFUL000080 [Ladona fulva]